MTDMAGQLVRARAPLRLGLGGGGTDVSPYSDDFGGCVLNATISMYSYVTVAPYTPGKVLFRAVDLGQEVEIEAQPDIPLDGLLRLHRGVYRRIVSEFNGGEPLSIAITTSSDAPAGSGLGSSSTLVVALVEAFREFLGLPLGDYDVAHLAYEIERIDLGLCGGKQDQYAAAFGGFNFMEFRSHDHVIVNPLRIPSKTIAEFEASLVLFFSGVSRESAAIIDDQNSLVVKGVKESLSALHEIKQSAFKMKEHLLRGEIRKFAEMMDAGWQSKKNVSSRITNPQIEGLYNVAKAAGAISGKVSGAGGGGFLMFITDPVNRVRLMSELNKCNGRVVPVHFTHNGSLAWRT